MALQSEGILINGALNIVVVATIMTMFEFVFFYKIVFPGILTSVKGAIRSFTTDCDDMSTKLLTLFSVEDIRNIFARIGNGYSNEDEEIKKLRSHFNPQINKIIDEHLSSNSWLTRVALGSLEDALVRLSKDATGAVFTLEERENRLRKKVNDNTVSVFLLLIVVLSTASAVLTMKATDRFGAYVTSGITVAALIAFQLHFYFVGKKWQYMGSNGISELAYNTWLRIHSVCK